MRLALCLSLLVVLSIPALGQDRPPTTDYKEIGALQDGQAKTEVDRLLRSTSVKDRTWAAYFVGKYELKEYIPSLVDSLQSARGERQDGGELLYRATLDSLIQLKVAVPAAELLPLYSRFPDEVMILLALASKENQETLLSLAREIDPRRQNQPYWLAACNLLTEAKSQGFAAYLLNELTINLTIHVTDQPNEGFGGSGSSWVGCGGSGGIWPDGFPPIAFYDLTDEPSRDRVVVAPGPRTIYYQRTLSSQMEHPALWPARSHYSWDKNDFLLDYFAALLGTDRERLRFANRRQYTVLWKNRDDYKGTVLLYRAEAGRSFDELKGRLADLGLLSPAESASLAPQIVTRVFDIRRNKAVRLPDIPGVNKGQ